MSETTSLPPAVGPNAPELSSGAEQAIRNRDAVHAAGHREADAAALGCAR